MGKTAYHKQFVDWDDSIMLQKVINQSTSRIEVLKNLGYNPRSTISRRKLNGAILKYGLDISHFNNRPDRWNSLPNKIKECFCIADVLRSVGLSDQGDNHKTAKRMIKELKLDTSHFTKTNGGTVSPYTDKDVFCEDSKVHRATVKSRVLKNNMIDYSCAICGITEWNGQGLSLELDHINGVNNDNRLTNLRFLCPNCHSLTPTHRGKNTKS